MRITQMMIILVLVYLPIISQIFGLGLKTFMKDSNFNGMRCSTNVSFEKAQVNSEVKCAAACMREDNCVSVFYSGTTNQCIGCISTMTSNSDLVAMVGSQYYHRTGQEYMGCYRDSSLRAMGNYEVSSPSMTIEMCSDICTEKETIYFAVQHGLECFCSDTYDRYGPSTRCNAQCAGNQKQICGGTLALKSGPEYMGCYVDSNPRAMDMYEVISQSMSTEMCSDFCMEKGTIYFGVEYGRECYCGDTYDRYGPSTNCNMQCAGNQEQICGGNLALSVYKSG